MPATNNHTSSIKHRRTLARRHPSAFLLMAQLVSLALYATFDKSSIGRALLPSFGILVLAMAVWVIIRSPKMRWIAWLLIVPAFVLSLLSVLFSNPALLFWSSLLEAAVYFYAAGTLIAYMMEDYRVTTDELFAAGATFTLFAWGFAFAYQASQAWFPGSYLSSLSSEPLRSFLELLSLSFTNLSATGLGDILPVTPLARALVMLEQFTGVAYVVTVVSRLIGMTLAGQRGKKTP